MKRLIVICLAALLSLPACSEDDTPTSAGGEFDTNLIGFWYRLELPGEQSAVRPAYHNVFYISPDGLYQSGGVETATGKIALLPKNRDARMHFAYAGRIGMSWFWPSEAAQDTLDYRVDWDVLTVSGYLPISGIWTRKLQGERVTEPLNSQFTCRIDDVEATIPVVAVQVGAWVSLKPLFVLTARIEREYGSASVRILIPGFTGPGSYSLANGKAEFAILGGDAISSFLTDSLHEGTITIDSFDSAAGRCSGSFEFTVRAYHDDGNPPELIRFTNGRFSVPIFQ